MFFERKKALKRNVATRQPARFVGKLLTLMTFAKPLETKGRSKSQQQKVLSDFTAHSRKPKEQNADAAQGTKFVLRRAELRKIAWTENIKIARSLERAENFAVRKQLCGANKKHIFSSRNIAWNLALFTEVADRKPVEAHKLDVKSG